MNVPADRSNGYEAVSADFMSRRTGSNIGVATLREWARALPAGAAVLDLGCGHGVPISQALVEDGFAVYGIDASPSMIAAFRARFPDAPAECGAVEDSEFFGRRFDAVVAWGLLFLLPADAQAKLIHRVAAALRPGGRFLFTAPHQACEWPDNLTGRKSVSLGSDVYRRIVEATGLPLDAEADDEGDNHYYFVRKPASHLQRRRLGAVSGSRGRLAAGGPAWLLVLALSVPTRAQERNAVDVLRALALDTLTGTITVYHSEGHGDRARRLQQWYAGAVVFYEDALAHDFDAILAILNPQDWIAFDPKTPYGLPHIDFSGWPHPVAVLPAANDEGLMADLARQLGLGGAPEVGRYVDVIGFHELGHALVVQYLYERASGSTISVRWFDEFMATYMGQGYLWHTEGADADPIRAVMYRDYVPTHTSLAEFEEHVGELATPQGWVNYGWYVVSGAVCREGTSGVRASGCGIHQACARQTPLGSVSGVEHGRSARVAGGDRAGLHRVGAGAREVRRDRGPPGIVLETDPA